MRGRLFALMLLAAAPIAVLMLANALHSYRAAEAAFRLELALERDALLQHHRAALETTAAVLSAAAAALPPSPWDDPTCADLLARVQASAPEGYSTLLVADAGGRVQCSPHSAREPHPTLADRPWFAELRHAAGSRVPRFVAAIDTLTPATPAAVVVARALLAPPRLTANAGIGFAGPGAAATEEGFAGAVIAALSPARFAPASGPATDGRPPPALWLIGDGGQMVLPLTPLAEAIGDPPPLPAIAATAGLVEFEAGARAATRQSPLLFATAPLGPGLSLLLGRPSAPALEQARQEAVLRLLELAALLGFCLGAVALGARYAVVRPLYRLHDAAARWRGSEGAPFDPGDLSGVPEEVRELAEALQAAADRLAARERELHAALEGREVLTAEVHHRVKNNLQVVSSLLNLQAQRIQEPGARVEFEAARDRVQALATLHRHLYLDQDHETIDLAAFIAELGGQLFRAAGERPGERIALAAEAPSLRISSDQAVPLALIITEAVSSALKFAFPTGRSGRIEIRVEASDGGEGARSARLSIRDDGVGWHAPASAATTAGRPDAGLGGQLLRALARQLGGALTLEEGRSGTSLRLDFPLRPPLPRPPPSLRRSAPPAPSAGA